MYKPISCVIAAAVVIGWAATRPEDIPFERQMIDPGASESLAVADVNGDGRVDLVSGEFWYQAPKWTKHRFRNIDFTNNYIDVFSDLAMDVNGDGRVDIVSCSWFSKRIWWNENPGKSEGMWKEHVVETKSPVEFAFLVDLDNDGKAREILPEFGDAKMPLTWYEAKGGEFAGHAISDKSYGHGIGAGDVNKDGRTDILVPKGWFEAPADPKTGSWTFHQDFDLGETGFIHVMDVNGDGRPDIVTSLAHNYGIFWMEQMADGKWVKHMIDSSWSQSHSLAIVDVNGDGRPDLLTGKRFMAHNGNDPGEKEPLGLYWYESMKTEKGAIEWVKHVIDYGGRAGAGMQMTAAKVEGHSYPEILAAGKSGLFLFRRAQ